MARQLSEQEHEVSLLALMDTYPLGYQKLLAKSAPQNPVAPRMKSKIRAHLRNLRTLGPIEKLKYLCEKSTYGPKKIQINTWQTLYRIFRKSGRPLPRVLRNVEQFNYIAAREYVPKVYPGKVTLFWASEDLNTGHDAVAGWEVLASGGVEIRELPGTHLNIIKEPFVEHLAREISSCLADQSRQDSRDLEVAA